MTTAPSHKAWLSPITAVAFIAVTATGVMMLFHARVPGIRGLHEWMGIVMGAAGLLHLLLNWKAFASYFRRRRARVALAVALSLVAVVLLLPGSEDQRRGRERRGRPAPAATVENVAPR